MSNGQITDELLVADAAIADPVYVGRQLKTIEEGLTRVLFGDYTVVIRMEEGSAVWGNLAMHINVAINAARNAISRAEESEHKAEAARDEAIAAARAEAQFLTNVSHELRTPLSSIRAAAEILSSYPDENPETRSEFAGIIVKEAERLTRLIENVLDLGKIQARRLHWDFRQVQLSYTLAEVVRNFNIGAVDVQYTVENPLPMTFGDRDRLKQLWTNLIDNAIKFSGDGEKVYVHAKYENDVITVEVRDRGIGVRAEDQQVIFKRFCQVSDSTLTDKPGGTGLGLAISKEIVTHHGGKIEVESEYGHGSTFRVILPMPQRGELEDLDQRLRTESEVSP